MHLHNERFLLMSHLQGKLSSIENQRVFRNEIEFPGHMLCSMDFRHFHCVYTQTDQFQRRCRNGCLFLLHILWKIRIRIRHRKLYWISLKSLTMRQSCVRVKLNFVQSCNAQTYRNHLIMILHNDRAEGVHSATDYRYNARTAAMHILHAYPRYMNMAFIVTSTLKCAVWEHDLLEHVAESMDWLFERDVLLLIFVAFAYMSVLCVCAIENYGKLREKKKIQTKTTIRTSQILVSNLILNSMISS